MNDFGHNEGMRRMKQDFMPLSAACLGTLERLHLELTKHFDFAVSRERPDADKRYQDLIL